MVWFATRCRVCMVLKRDLAREGEVQARATTLDQAEMGLDPVRQETILASRKRQMQTASRLHLHELLEHTA
jgi:hypothetical protein